MKYLFYPWPDWIESFPAVLFFSPCSRLFLDLSPSPESLPTAGPSPPERPLQAGHHRSGRRRRARGRNVAAYPPDASCTRHVPRAHPLGRRLKAICPSPSRARERDSIRITESGVKWGLHVLRKMKTSTKFAKSRKRVEISCFERIRTSSVIF